MSIPTSRRAMLAGAATLSAASAVNLAAIAVTRAEPLDADAELLVLGEKLRAAQKAVAAQSDLATERHKAYQACKVPMPEVCRCRPEDKKAIGVDADCMILTHDGFYGRRQVEAIRKLPPEVVAYDIEGSIEDTFTMCKVTRQRDQARIAEVIKAFEEWNEVDDALRRETGYDRADDDMGKVLDVQADIMGEIAATPARTMEGLRVKAMAALAFNFDRPENIYEERPEFPEMNDAEDVMWQLAWDILEMTGGAPKAAVQS